MADAAGAEAHQHLAGLRPLELDVLDDERLGELLENGGADLHRQTLKGSDPLRVVGGYGRTGQIRVRRPATLTVLFHEREPVVARITV